MRTVDISGMGDSYEATCQKMLLNGMRWLKEHPQFNFEAAYRGLKDVYGICIPEKEEAKALDRAVCDGMDATGAMHEAVISHLAYIHSHTYDGWLAAAEKQGCTIYERADEDALDNALLMAEIEWQLKLAGGYNPEAELFKQIPREDVIHVNMSDPDSVRQAVKELVRRIKKC